jgi:iron complex outermembrane recepter protein
MGSIRGENSRWNNTAIKVFFPILTACYSTLTQAQFTENDMLSDIPMVSAASRFQQRLDQAPASVTIIDRELIELSGAQDIPELFRLVPGFQAYRVTGNRFGVSYHGIGKEFPNQMEVMVNGRSVYESLFSSVHWSTLGIEIHDIDYIEVVRGSNAAARGSNAYLGSINIVTRKPVQDSGLGLKVSAGDWQTRDASLRYNNSLGATDYRISLGYRENEGFPAVTSGPMEDGHDLIHGNVSATYTPTLVDTLNVSAGFARDRTGWGDSDHPDEFIPADAYSQFQSLNWQHSFERGHSLDVQVYHNKFKISNWLAFGRFHDFLGIDQDTAAFLTSFDPTPPELLAMVADMFGSDTAFAQRVINELNTDVYGGFGEMESERYDLEAQHNFQLSSTIRGTWGLGIRNESLKAFHPQSIDQDLDELIARVFTHGEWQIAPAVVINGGTMVEDSPQGVLISPRISTNFNILPGQTLRLAYARGNRAPSLLEANEHLTTHVNDVIVDTVRVSDPNLGEEQLDSFEIGYLLQRSDPDIQLDVRIFRERMKEVINKYSVFNPPEDTYFGDFTHKLVANFGTWTIDGAEFQLTYRPWPETLLRLHYSNIDLDTPLDFQIFPQPGVTTKGNRMATHTGGILLSQRITPAWTATLSAFHESELTWEDGEYSDGFTRVDAQLIYRHTLGSTEARIRLVAQNLGNEHYEFNVNNHFERRFFVTFELDIP